MSVTKEDALAAMRTVYEYASTKKGGPNSAMAREIGIWMQREFKQEGVTAIQSVRRDRNAAAVAPVLADPAEPARKLARFVHPRSQQKSLGEPEGVAEVPRQGPKAIIHAKPLQAAPPQVSADQQAAPQERVKAAPKAKKESTENESPVVEAEAVPDAPAVVLNSIELASLRDRKPRTILMEFGADRISATLTHLFNVQGDDMPAGQMQKAALLKQKAESV